MTAQPYLTATRVQPGYFHRLGIAARAEDGVAEWLTRLLGARPIRTGMRQVHGLPMPQSSDAGSMDSGARSEMLWLGNIPIAVFVSADPNGPLGRYVARYGTGLHSVAWTVEDLWGAETLLRRKDIRITGSDLPGRHFFMHPADTSGLLIEWSDTEFERDPRDGAELPQISDPLIEVRAVAWMTVAVRDAIKSAEILQSIVDAERVAGLRAGDPAIETTVDLRIGDVLMRLVSARDSRSPFAASVAESGERMHSTCLVVDDLATTLTVLEHEGIPVVAREDARAWTDPTATLGLRFEWIDSSSLS
jgi:hypothetical protein